MSEIYGFYAPNKCIDQVVEAISKGLSEFTFGFSCTVRDSLSRDNRSKLIQVSIHKDKDKVLDQLVSNIARTLSSYSDLPWLVGLCQYRDTDIVWDHTIPSSVRFKWQRRKYIMKLDKAHMVFARIIEEILTIYRTGVETNNRLDEVLRNA